MADVGPDGASMERALRLLERSHSDHKVSDALGRRKYLVTDALTGEPVPHFIYRLECGHLVAIYTVPLPSNVRALFCSECSPKRDRLIVELLLDAPDEWIPPEDRAEASCEVCLEAAAAGSHVPIDHEH